MNKKFLYKISEILEPPLFKELNNYGITQEDEVYYIFKNIFGPDILILESNKSIVSQKDYKFLYVESPNGLEWYIKRYTPNSMCFYTSNNYYSIEEYNEYGNLIYSYNSEGIILQSY
jgi:hypothetical protein